jgi:hypothetical protein
MTQATEPKYWLAPVWPGTGLEYPVTSVVVGVACDQDDRATTGRDEDRAR